MMRLNDYLFSLSLLTFCALAHSTVDKTRYYRAAVVEHVRFGDFSHSVHEILEKNFETYEIATRTAAQNDADIVVFPEWGLYPHTKHNRSWVKLFAEDIPDPKTSFTNPCIQADKFKKYPVLQKLSCLANQNKIFLVANIADTKPCTIRESCESNEIDSCSTKSSECPEDGVYFHNTNVVFNREGTLVARYYKRHLYFEFDMNLPQNLEDAYFETDFGMFTTFICFDLVFNETVTAIEKSDVINVAYPTYWFDSAPFGFSATSYQQAWAMTNKVNLHAANVQHPRSGTMGSGIYSASRGALAYTNNPDKRSKLLISNVPRFIDEVEGLDLNAKMFFIENDSALEDSSAEKSILKETVCSLNMSAPLNPVDEYNCFHDNSVTYTFLKLNNTKDSLKVCSNDFCCHLTYEAVSMQEDYFLGVFSGDLVSNGAFSYGIETCFLTRCIASDDGKCTNYVTKSTTVFQTINLRGDFTAKYVYPTVLDSDLRLSDKTKWQFKENSEIAYDQLGKDSSILQLGLIGRNYERDYTLLK